MSRSAMTRETRLPKKLDDVAEGDHGKEGDGRRDADHGRGDKEGLVCLGRHEVFLKKGLDPVGNRLEEPERPHPRGAVPHLDAPEDLAFGQREIGHRAHEDAKDHHDLGAILYEEVDQFHPNSLYLLDPGRYPRVGGGQGKGIELRPQ